MVIDCGKCYDTNFILHICTHAEYLQLKAMLRLVSREKQGFHYGNRINFEWDWQKATTYFRILPGITGKRVTKRQIERYRDRV